MFSTGGHKVLIKVVLQSIPSYVMGFLSPMLLFVMSYVQYLFDFSGVLLIATRRLCGFSGIKFASQRVQAGMGSS